MAKAKTKSGEEKPEAKSRAEAKELLTRIRDRYKVMTEADQDNRRKALEDLKFAHEPGAQWDDALKKERGDRPCYEFNKLRITIKRVINHIRANRPAGKVRAVEDGDKDTAEIYDGLIRNIWNVSDADTVVDYAAEYVVAGGMGAWRVTTEYSDDTAFEQDIFIRPIKNPFCLYADPTASDPFKRDAEDWILTEKISNNAYESRYPKKERTSFEDTEFDDDTEWEDEETTRICEYWYKKPYEKTLCLLSDGKTVDKSELTPDAQVVRERVVKCHKICMVIASGDAILEGPTEWAGSMFPFVQVHGEWRVIDGKVQWHGLTRFSKDSQRAYNTERTAMVEAVALTPTDKWMVTPAQVKGLEQFFAESHKKNYPYHLYNPDPGAPGPPPRTGGPQVPAALMQLAQFSSEDIKATSGIFDASLGNQSNETSGRAIRARQEQGEIATYNYPDNISKGVRITDEIIIDLIPKIIDTSRAIRILGADMTEKYVKVNQPEQDPETGEIRVMNDLTRGKYDVTVTSGPSYATQRMEASETFAQLVQAFPPLMQVAGDIVVKNMDVPGSEQLAERLKTMLPPQIQQQMAEGKPLPPEVQAAMAQVDQAAQAVQQQGQLVQAAAQEAEQSKAEAEKAKAEVEKAMAQLKTAEAQFQAKVATEIAKIQQAKAGLDVQSAGLDVKAAQLQTTQTEVDGKLQQTGVVDQAVENINGLAQEFTQIAQEIMNRLDAVEAPKPKTTKKVRAVRRKEGGLEAQVDEIDELGQVVGTRTAVVNRGPGGELVGEMN
jgi:hypothetical protein